MQEEHEKGHHNHETELKDLSLSDNSSPSQTRVRSHKYKGDGAPAQPVKSHKINVTYSAPVYPDGAYVVSYYFNNKGILCAKDNLGRVAKYSSDDGWEWANKYENDGTADNSNLTSLLTDGIL